MVLNRFNMSQKQICLYSILGSFFCFGILVLITKLLILRRKKLISGYGIKTNFDNSDIPKKTKNKKEKYKQYEHDLMTYFDDLKFE